MVVAIVDYGSGNLRSCAKAFERVVAEGGLAQSIVVTADPKVVAGADRIVLPGVGAFADCRNGLNAVPGLRDALEQAVRVKRRPFLGICVGMQLLADRGLEHGIHQGLGWIAGEVVPLAPADRSLKIPHMGWNDLVFDQPPHPLLAGLKPGVHAYFVHSYHFRTNDPQATVAWTDYGGPVAAMIAQDNIAGTQFHPEKSQTTGLAVISNFLTWSP
jgi:glutamine amidotransferase